MEPLIAILTTLFAEIGKAVALEMVRIIREEMAKPLVLRQAAPAPDDLIARVQADDANLPPVDAPLVR